MIGMTRANAVNAFGNLRFYWPEYLMEAGELGLYMFSTCAIATLLQHPASPVRHVIANSFFRRAVMGLGMGATVVAFFEIHSLH
jgi:aquaporin Z